MTNIAKILAIRYAITALACGVTVPADAAFICPAYPKEYLAVGGDGLVYTAVSNGTSNVVTAICSVTANDDGVSPQACLAWYSLLLTLRNTGGHALPDFNESASSNASVKGCAGLNGWEHHVPYFLLAQ